MRIVTTIKLDQKQMPYWSAMLMQNDACLVEAVSKTFNPRNKKDFRELYENVTARMMKVIEGSKDRDSIVRMLIQEDVQTTNKPQGS